VLSKRARGEVGDEGLDDAYAGVAGSADDEDGGERHGREGCLVYIPRRKVGLVVAKSRRRSR
jgi:hypothetical protein